jgi:hypothetical protein
MQNRFAAAALTGTGCFESKGSTTAPQLVRGLREAGAPAIVVRNYAEGVIDIAIAGRTSAARPMLSSLLLDLETRQRVLGALHTIIVAADVAETVAWRMIGLPAAPVGDLSRYSPDRLASVAQSLSCLPAPDKAGCDAVKLFVSTGFIACPGPENEQLDLVLVVPYWTPLSWSPRDDESRIQILENLNGLVARAPDSWGGVGCWRPANERLMALKRAWAASRDQEFLGQLEQSLTTEVYLPPAHDDGECAPLVRPSYLKARRQFLEDAARNAFGLEAELARDAVFDAAERERITPLLQKAEFSDDPVEAMLYQGLASLGRQLIALDIEVARGPSIETFDQALKVHKQSFQFIRALDARGRQPRRRTKPNVPR